MHIFLIIFFNNFKNYFKCYVQFFIIIYLKTFNKHKKISMTSRATLYLKKFCDARLISKLLLSYLTFYSTHKTSLPKSFYSLSKRYSIFCFYNTEYSFQGFNFLWFILITLMMQTILRINALILINK